MQNKKMKTEKDLTGLKGSSYFQLDKYGNTYLDFDNQKGLLSFGAYSYEISSTGHGELTEEQTKCLFVSMLNYYRANCYKI